MTLSCIGRYYCCHQGHRCEPHSYFHPHKSSSRIIGQVCISSVCDGLSPDENRRTNGGRDGPRAPVHLTARNSSQTKNAPS
ncbi:hypothetical protein KPH14_004093 [Odynerus spinipes]|uniref:Uncharacterized protein n=1 Tax=Odynerus spinipes TaxID=1348599 RepID=A0AAD9VV66_9HYME|nr:hypothetical protein KPH14_004093 [Odynerus spinipes]